MEWYVLNENFNEKKIEHFNIFDSWTFSEAVKNLLTNFITFEDFVEKLDKELKYAFWSKAEYEILIMGLFDEKAIKIDVYSQVKPNIKILANYIIDEHNKCIGESCWETPSNIK